MNVTMTPTGDVTARLNVKVEEGDYKADVTAKLKEIGRTRAIKGFRQGHAPMGQLERMFGAAVTSDVINDKVYRAVYDYLREHKVDVLGQPIPVEVKPFDPKAKEHEFEYDLALAPKINLTVDKDIHVPYYTIKVDKEMVDKEDADLRKRFGNQVPGETVETDAIVKGSLQQLNADGTINENEGAIQVVNGIIYPALFKDKEQAELFIGKHVGDKVAFNPWKTCTGNPVEMASMLNIDKAIAGDVHSDFEMAISEIIVVKPAELGEEYYENTFGKEVTTEEQYRDHLEKMISAQLRGNSEQLFERDARKVLLDKAGKLELPDATLQKWLIMQDDNLTEENIAVEYEKMRPGLEWELVSGKIERDCDVKVDEADVMQAAKGMAAHQFAQYGMLNMDDSVIEQYAKRMLDDKAMARRIYEGVSNRKLFAAIKERVTLDQKEVTLDELRAIAAAE